MAVNAPDDGDQQHGGRCQHEQGVAARHHVDAGSDHRRGMDQGADRGRAFHGVGQPDVQRHLCRLPACSNEKQNADGGDVHPKVPVGRGCGFRLVENSLEIERAEHTRR